MVQRAVQVTWDDRPNVICSSKQFGPSSEKSVELEEQTSLFNEPETLADPKAAEPDLEQIVYKRKKQAGKRELDFSKLPTEQIVHELPEGEQVCPVCGGEMHACGHEVVRRELRYVPAQYKVVEHVQTAYSCRNCEKNALATPMKKSEVPAGLIPGSRLLGAHEEEVYGYPENPAQRRERKASGTDWLALLQQIV